jgi:hypothetical protein
MHARNEQLPFSVTPRSLSQTCHTWIVMANIFLTQLRGKFLHINTSTCFILKLHISSCTTINNTWLIWKLSINHLRVNSRDDSVSMNTPKNQALESTRLVIDSKLTLNWLFYDSTGSSQLFYYLCMADLHLLMPGLQEIFLSYSFNRRSLDPKRDIE